MSLRKFILVSIIVTGALAGQPLSASQTVLDASNAEVFARARAAEPRQLGTVSVQELRRPLSEDGLRLLDKAKDSIARGETARGMEQLRAAQRDPSVEAYALGMLATEHIKRGDAGTALVELESAVALQPGIAANQSNLAYLLGAKQRNEEALVHAKKALQLDPSHSKTRFVLAQILLQMGRREEAVFHPRRAAEEIPGAGVLLTRVMQGR